MSVTQFFIMLNGIKLEDIRRALSSPQQSGAKKQAQRPLQQLLLQPHQQQASQQQQQTSQSSQQQQQQQSLIDFANYSTYPRTFTTADAHPKHTNLLCWHCSLSFNSIPRFFALSSLRQWSEQTGEFYEWQIDGNFCSWACAAAYIHEHFEEPKKGTLMQNLSIIRSQSDGCRIRSVRRAPSKTIMSSYCGALGMSQQAFADLVESISQP